MLRLWNKLVNVKNASILRMVFLGEYNLGLNNWCSEIEHILGNISCHDIFNEITECNLKECESKLLTEYEHSWESVRLEKSKLRSYNLFKKKFGTENDVRKCDKYSRSHIAQLRSGIFPLNIELGRRRQIPLQDNKCKVSKSCIMSHHVLVSQVIPPWN